MIGTMNDLILLLNEMKARGLIADYAIGGATALIYYFEPIQTQDIDVFVVLEASGQALVNLSPIYSFLAERGCQPRNEYVVINGIPVQFLVPYNSLVQEAVGTARTVKFGATDCRIPSLEHLMAIMVQTGRAKDKARLEELAQHPALFDTNIFLNLIAKFGLEETWQKIKNQIAFL
jgi:hypothetical protein